MKVAITGGHLSPAVAVIEKLKNRKNTKIVFFGRKHPFDNDTALSFEYQTIKKMNIPFRLVNTGKLKRHITLDALLSAFQIPKGTLEANRKVREEKPDILLSFGGFLALPVALACYLQGIPIVIHEQTQHAGLTNKILAKLAAKVCITFPSSQRYFPKKKTLLTGNPIREDVLEVKQKIIVPKNEKIIYITGGSTGAHYINNLVKDSLTHLLKLGVVVHQTGDTTLTNDYGKLQKIRASLTESEKERYIIKKFVPAEELGWLYKNADLVIARSGINTVLELLATKSVALLLPLKVGQKNEQLENAKYFASSGLGEYLENDVTPDLFIAKIKDLLKNSIEKKKSAKDIYEHNNAAEAIVNELVSHYEKKRKKTA